MLPKSFTVTAPLDQLAPQLERYLSLVAGKAVQVVSGTYIGTGRGFSVPIAVSPLILITIPVYAPTQVYPVLNDDSNNVTISFRDLPGITWIVGYGYVNDAILSVGNFTLQIGANSVVNTLNQEYKYFIIG